MKTTPLFLLFSTSIIIFFTTPALSDTPCKPDSCNSNVGPLIRFPFQLKDRQPAGCGYPGFDLYCNSQNETILNLPESGEFIVDQIDYIAQALYIHDPNSCISKRLLNFSLSGSPFIGADPRNYAILNCSSDFSQNMSGHNYVPLSCLSGRNYTVVAVNSLSSVAQVPATCREVANVSVPVLVRVSEFYWSTVDFEDDVVLVWREPACSDCERQGGVCGFKNDPGLEINCYRPSKSGLPRGAKYGIIIGVGIPGLVCLVGLACYAGGMIRASMLGRRVNSQLPIITSDHNVIVRVGGGLDGRTIESYPLMVLGESRRLPKTSDGTCPICLCDYQPKEKLRSIPECNHYFHSDCIGEWLKLNGTCPVCRNSPQSSVATPLSSLSFSSSSSSRSTTADPQATR